ncbi:hypothetical protein [Microbacterium sp. NPDC057650]|uniref:hypothetical protein n=1 Tax=unclassified Microbacterium TaxID=2609290 RepID=UPI00366F8642
MASAQIVAIFLLVVTLPALRSIPQIERRVSARPASVLLLLGIFAAIIWISVLVWALNIAFASDAPRDWQTHLQYGSRLLLWSCTSWGLVLSGWCATWSGRRRRMLGASIVAVLGSALIITCARFVVTAPAM